eukprot:CAMPEP_0172467098 /NCGR_PEP_ID=MMETSP1065-20121228/57942_1 /TAXON_ID=265537 /ORGANISM="Amphiprora paludosa, Strain CCMP125" /LENGTH=218 /DNA_ID=CAMNT_0013224143 /DNA_START=49 /DNA_END=702 /DNA_ORIENTATION=-
MALLKKVNARLEERGMNPKDWSSLKAYVQMLAAKDDEEEIGGEQTTLPLEIDNNSTRTSDEKSTKSNATIPLMTSGEMEEFRENIQQTMDPRDPDSLFCPGVIYHMYDLWAKPDYEREMTQLKSTDISMWNRLAETITTTVAATTKSLSNEDDEAANEEKEEDTTVTKEKLIPTAECLMISNCSSPVLRHLEVDERMLSDHLSPAYRSSLKSLLHPQE